jgi:hypothetical protein
LPLCRIPAPPVDLFQEAVDVRGRGTRPALAHVSSAGSLPLARPFFFPAPDQVAQNPDAQGNDQENE